MKRVFALLVIVLSSGVLLTGCLSRKAARDLAQYKLGLDVIPALTAVVGSRDVSEVSSGSSDGVQYLKVVYESGSVLSEVQQYADALQEAGFLCCDVSGDDQVGWITLGQHSVDEGKVLRVTISYEQGFITVLCEKMDGTLQIFTD